VGNLSPQSPGCPWNPFEPAQVFTCEERLCAWVRQPANAYSSLALLAVGVLLLSKSIRAKNTVYRDFGWIALLIGVSSFLAHASQIRFFDFF
jgi:hypothetical protein